MNPYKSPTLEQELTPEIASRHDYIFTESCINAIRLAYCFGGCIWMMTGLTFAQHSYSIFFTPLFMGLGLVELIIGVGLGNLKPWSPKAGKVFAVFTIINFPVGTLISIYTLWVLSRPQCKVIFSQEYKKIIAETCHVRITIPAHAWIILVVAMALLFVTAALVNSYYYVRF